MIDEVLELTLAVRAALEASAARGLREEPPGELPAAAPPAPAASPQAASPQTASPQVAAPVPAAPAPVAAAPGWTALARTAREEGPPPATALQRVREELGDCRRCALCKERRQIVFGVGDPAAALVIVGEAPGYQEDLDGEPFVGPAGQMLDRMLENVIGLPRSGVYILNVVKCRPPKNRNPEPDEIEACRPFLEAQLRALAPKVLLVLGSVAIKALLRTDAGITRLRGQWQTVGGVPTMPTFHPAYLLRQPDDKRLTFADLKALRARMEELGVAPPRG